MRTRRSPRNQERLWKELGREGQIETKTIGHVNRCFDCLFYPVGGRMRGTCSKLNKNVSGMEQRECFKQCIKVI